MPKKNTDESLADGATEPVADEALTDATAIDEAPAVEPEDFDLIEWLEGLGPEVARYPLPGGGFIPLRARTSDWAKQWHESVKDLTFEEKALRFLAAHIVDDAVPLDALAKMQQYRPKDFELAFGLASLIDDSSASLINPAFLPGASG